MVVKYSPFTRQSAGMREFVARYLPGFMRLNPQIEVTQYIKDWRGDPALRGYYRDGTTRTINVRRQPLEAIMMEVIFLRGTVTGFSSEYRLPRHQTTRPSIQGFWSPDVVDALKMYDDVVVREGPEEGYEWPYREDNQIMDVRTHEFRERQTITTEQDPMDDDIYYMDDINKYVTTRPLPSERLSTHKQVDKDGVPVKYPDIPDRRIFPHLPHIIK